MGSKQVIEEEGAGGSTVGQAISLGGFGGSKANGNWLVHEEGYGNRLVRVGKVKTAQPWSYGKCLGFPRPKALLEMHVSVC